MRSVFFGLLALVATACSGGGSGVADAEAEARAGALEASSPAATHEMKGCDLLSVEEVSAALGGPPRPGEAYGVVGCAWETQAGARLSIQLFTGSAFTPATCDGQKFLVAGRQEEIAGLGDHALWGSTGDLVVCSSTAVLKMDVENTPAPPSEDRAALIAVARAALGRL